MDGIELLAQARALGLKVTERRGRLVMRGPARLEGLARQLIEARVVILAALSEEADQRLHPAPTAPCRCCGGQASWRRTRGHWVCGICHPAPCGDAVAEQRVAVDQSPATSGLAEELERALRHFAWEPGDGGPRDHHGRGEAPAVIPPRSAKKANYAKEAGARTRGATSGR